MTEMILGNDALIAQLKVDPEKTLKSVAAQVTKSLPQPVIVTDYWTYRIVVIALGIVVISAMLGAVYLSAQKMVISDLLTALGAAAIGALAGLLTPLPGRSR